MAVPAGWPLFHVPALPTPGRFVLSGPEGRHAATVRRMRVGERLALTDGRGVWAAAEVLETGRAELTLQVDEPATQAPAGPTVTVVQALPKGERSELAVELATEAGADVIVPWAAQRCVARWTGDKAGKGAQRWRDVSREAAKQSRRVWFPQVTELHSTPGLAGLVDRLTGEGGLALLLHEAEARPIVDLPLAGVAELLIVVGPEGGISPAELETLRAAGAHPVRLGHEVLRTSTAAAVALGALGALTTRWQ